MGASAIRLVIAEFGTGRPPQIVEEASRGVLLGRDTFSGGIIRPKTIDAALAALGGFRAILDGYGVTRVTAVATSAVREARNADLFLDRVQGSTGFSFEIIDEAEEARLLFRGVKQALRDHAVFDGAWTLLTEVGGGSTSLTLLQRGQPVRSGVYALGAIRLPQRLDLRWHRRDLRLATLKRAIATVVSEIRLEIPLRRVTQMIALGGDVRFAAAQIAHDDDHHRVRELSRDTFQAFCDQIENLEDDELVARFRLPAVEAETLVPALLIYRTLLSATVARRLVVSDASLRGGVLLDLVEPERPTGTDDFNHQVLASAEAVGQRYRFDRSHGRHVAALATCLFDQLRDEHRLSARERLLLETASLLHDVGIYVSLRAHHKHSQYLLAASQIFGLSNDETAIVANIARYHRRGVPQASHLAYLALDRHDRLIVNKLAAILRVVNALDAEHLQKVGTLRLVRDDRAWVLELEGTGDMTVEQMAATARADMFADVFGRQLVVRAVGIPT